MRGWSRDRPFAFERQDSPTAAQAFELWLTCKPRICFLGEPFASMVDPE
jgi:hypothetical protein